MADLREALEAQFEAAEDGTLDTPIERDIEVNDDPIQAENRSQEASEEGGGQEDRDEKGRFKSKSQEASRQDNSNQELNADGQASNVADEFTEVKEIQRPTTFKKEFVPIWEKMAKGEVLTPEESRKFAEYTAVTRENEFKNGVSIYRKEAESAKGLVDAMQPFLPELQKAGIHPVAWIQSLGRAHYMLAQGSPEQKQQMFQQLARDYGVQLPQGSGEQQYDPNYALMQELNALKSEVGQVRNWREQEETTRLMGEITQVASNTEKYPHFEALRIPMAQLLEQGGAKDLDDAYEKAKWNVPEVRELEIQKLVSKTQNQVSKQQQVAKAKAVAVSPRSVTPNGVVATNDKKDRRSMLESQLDNFTGNRF